jgi:pimeloyl-ACP methyl ester carboxylesterase
VPLSLRGSKKSMIKDFTYKHKHLKYRVEGGGLPVMLIHGFGEDSKIWERQINFLKDNFRLIIPDLPGSGESEMIDDMSIEGMAEAVKAIAVKELNETHEKALHMIGHSMGGYITLAFAEIFSDLLLSFGLFHSTAYADSEEKKSNRKKSIEFIKTHGSKAFLETTIPGLFAPDNKVKMDDEISVLIQKSDQFKPEALIAYYKAMINRPDRTEVLMSTKVPVFFGIGTYDNAAPMDDMLKQSHLPSVSSVTIFQESGHMGMIEESEKANEILARFLNR